MGEEERPSRIRGDSASLQYIADMHLTMSSESLLGVSGTWSEMRVPRCSAKLSTFGALFSAYWREITNGHKLKCIFSRRTNGMTGLELASVIENVSEWQGRRARGEPSNVGEALTAKPELCGKAEWQRLIRFCSLLVLFLDGLLSGWQADWTVPFSRLDKAPKRGVLASRKLPRGVSRWEPTVLSLFDGDADVTCWSKAFRYKDRRYCSKYTTSSSKTAISLINSVAGWSCKKGKKMSISRPVL